MDAANDVTYSGLPSKAYAEWLAQPITQHILGRLREYVEVATCTPPDTLIANDAASAPLRMACAYSARQARADMVSLIAKTYGMPVRSEATVPLVADYGAREILKAERVARK